MAIRKRPKRNGHMSKPSSTAVADSSYELAFQARPPAFDPPSALLLLLHGVGGNESNLAALAAGVGPDTLVILPRGPLALGPGLGTGPSTLKLLETLLPRVTVPMVLDADGLVEQGLVRAADGDLGLVAAARAGELADLDDIEDLVRVGRAGVGADDPASGDDNDE